jgi:tetratricopeptide (TPR) repeat protein
MHSLLLSILMAASAAQADSVPLYNNLGDHSHKISTRSSVTQQYFDQGLRLIYAFNHAEAIASFQQALRTDPRCAMCWWGIAFAYGPNINAGMDSASGAAAHEAATRAAGLTAGITPVEQAFIAAIGKRYGKNPAADRAKLDSAYALAMSNVARRFPQDDDAQVLYADAIMNLSPWIYWTADRKPRPQTQALLDALDLVTRRNARHAGACHLWIHAVEAAFPKRAETCADRLAGLMPGAGHIVHMPGHIYVRIGRYADAIRANQHAIHEDETFIADRNPQGVYPLGYYPHNYHFLNFAAMMAANEAIAMKSATDLAAKATPELLRMPGLGGAVQHYSMTPLFAAIRFERWSDILSAPQPASDLTYSQGLWRYARGLAYARQGQTDRAAGELAELRKLAGSPALESLYILSYNNGKSVLSMALATLEGEIAAAQKTWDEAITHLKTAMAVEDGLVYIEPPEWPVTVRQHLGRIQLAAGRWADAEVTFNQDLDRFAENVWALRGLAESLTRQGKTAAANAVQKRIERALQGSAVPHQH